MPSYDYEIRDVESGETLGRLTLIRSVAQRDAVVLQRVQVPKRINVAMPLSDEERRYRQDMKNIYKEEQRLGADFEHVFSRSKEDVKEIWSRPEPAAAATNSDE